MKHTIQFAVCSLLLIAPTSFAQSPGGLLAGGADPTGVAVQDNQGNTTYYVVSTGRGINLSSSPDLRTWKRLGRVFEEDVPAWAKQEIPESNGIWAPDLSYHDGLYYLYYSVSSFGSQRSVIGLAVNKSLDPQSPDYEWVDRGKVIESWADRVDFNAIDPALFVDEDGKWLLVWGSHWGGLKVIEVDPKTGKPLEGAERQSIAARPNTRSHAIEAPFVMYHEGYYYLFVSWDACCDGADSTYKVTVGRSKSSTGPYVDQAGRKMTDGGGTVVLESDDRWRGPGHNGVITNEKGHWMIHHTYDMENLRAQRILQVRPMTWSEDGWPIVGHPLELEWK